MSNDTGNDGGYTPVWLFSNWANHWFTGVACAIFANILIFYTTRIYGRRLAIIRERQQKERRLQRQDSFFNDTDGQSPIYRGGLEGARLNELDAGAPTVVLPAKPKPVQENGHVEKVSDVSSNPNGNGSPGPASQGVAPEEDVEQQIPPESPVPLPPPALITSHSTIANKEEHKTKKCDLVKVVILALLIQAFQFAALSIVSLALVTPLTSLFFVWWRVATLESTRRKIRKEMSSPHSWSLVLYFVSLRRALTYRFWSITLSLVTASAMVIAGGPHMMYVVAVHKVVKLDIGLMIYITIVLVLILIQGTLGQSKQTMESLARWFGLKRVTDLEPLVLGVTAGLLGGQYLLLVKLLAEIAEAAFLMPTESPSGESVFILIIFALVVGVFHLQAWRSGMGLPRTKLFIPTYRFAFVISGLIASVLVLREFFESSPAMIVVYSIGVFINLVVLFVLSKNALNAVKRDDFSTVIFLEEDTEAGIGARAYGRTQGTRRVRNSMSLINRRKKNSTLSLNVQPPPDMRRSRSAPGHIHIGRPMRAASADSLLESGETPLSSRRRMYRYSTPRSSVIDQPELFFSSGTPVPVVGARRESTDSSKRSLLGTVDGGAELSHHGHHSHAYNHHRMPSQSIRRQSRSHGNSLNSDNSSDSDGYESAGSFHSEPAETHLHEFQQSVPRESPLHMKLPLDYEYTSPKSMIVPKGSFNPWAPQGQSFYFDCAAVPGNFKVRGPTYLEDGQKIKCDISRMKLVMGEWLYNPETPTKNVCNDPEHFIQREHVGRRNRPFLFVLNLMVPSVGNAVFTWCRRPNLEPDEVFERILDEFIHHPSDDFRNKMFKIIPGVPEGSFIAKKAVGNKPAMLCAKVPTTYYRGDNWFEVCVDCAQSRVAFSVMGAIKGFASGLTLQLGFLLESSTPETLPERLLGGITIVKPQMVPDPQKRPNELAVA